MKNRLTKKFVREFEREQSEYGTEVALYNVIWTIAAEILKSIGVKGLKTS